MISNIIFVVIKDLHLNLKWCFLFLLFNKNEKGMEERRGKKTK